MLEGADIIKGSDVIFLFFLLYCILQNVFLSGLSASGSADPRQPAAQADPHSAFGRAGIITDVQVSAYCSDKLLTWLTCQTESRLSLVLAT